MRTLYINLLAILVIAPNIHSTDKTHHNTTNNSKLYEIACDIAPFVEAAAVESAGYYISHCDNPVYTGLTCSGVMFIIGYLRSIYNTYSEKIITTKGTQAAGNFILSIFFKTPVECYNYQQSRKNRIAQLQGIENQTTTNLTVAETEEIFEKYKEYQRLKDQQDKPDIPISQECKEIADSTMKTGLVTSLLLACEGVGAMCGNK